MKIGYFQFDIKNSDKQFNINKVKNILKNSNCELLVLPELFNVGYLFDSKSELTKCAENIPCGETTERLRNISKEEDCTIIGGIAELEGEEIYNTAIVVSKGNFIGKYRKMHLSNYEKTLFSHGTEVKIFNVDGLEIGVQICFDLWFPEVSRELMIKGADIICALANFGGDTTPKIAKVRAIENLTPLVLCNRIGEEKGSKFDAKFLGSSFIVDSKGKSLCSEVIQYESFNVVDIPLNDSKNKGNVICSDFLQEIGLHNNI